MEEGGNNNKTTIIFAQDRVIRECTAKKMLTTKKINNKSKYHTTQDEKNSARSLIHSRVYGCNMQRIVQEKKNRRKKVILRTKRYIFYDVVIRRIVRQTCGHCRQYYLSQKYYTSLPIFQPYSPKYNNSSTRIRYF